MARIIRFYHRWRELINIGGWLIMFCTVCSGIYIICDFISTANATAASVTELKQFREDTKVSQAKQGEDIKNINEKLEHIDLVQGKIFDRINQIADRRSGQ